MVKVSVILPFYKAKNTLNRAIVSIAQQSFADFECILVANNADELSVEIAKNWCKKDARFQLIFEKQQGVMFASNAGANVAQGEYLARMDADDWCYPGRLQMQADFLDKNSDYDVVSGLVTYVPHHKNTQGFARYVNWVNKVQTNEQICASQFIESPIVNPTAMWRQETSARLGLYKSGDFPEDYEMWLRWLAAGVKIEKIKQPIIKWFDSENRLTRTHAIYRDEAFFKIKSKYLALWLQQNKLNHFSIYVWGASKISRRRVRFLSDKGITIAGFIDIKNSRQLDESVVHYTDIPTDKRWFILVYMKHTTIRKQIVRYLQSIGYKETQNYLLVS